MADKFSPAVRSKIMASIRSSHTKIEVSVFRELRRRGIYFQKHYKKALGSPDVALPKKKRAVFLDGDFWHGYRYPAWKKRLPNKFWTAKIERNIARDRRYFAKLRRSGWRILRIWEHELTANFTRTVDKIETFLRE